LKKVSNPCISQALAEIDDREYRKVLNKLIAQKQTTVKESHPQKKNYKIAQQLISRGFEPEMIWDILRSED